MALTNFPNGITSFGVPVLGGGSIPFTGKYFFVDPVSGNDGHTGTSPSKAFATLYKAHAECTAGNNDVVYLIGDGSSSATARLSLALAQAVDSSVTAGTLVWSKNATHLIGITAPTSVSQRARIAPPTGTYTMATFGSGNFVTVSAAGCMFANISLFHGFSTGGASQICWTDTGGRNYYENVHFGGAGDAASAQATTSRSLLVSGTGECTFVRCTVGLDTVTKTVANASLELAGATPRNRFTECVFPLMTSAATPLFILGTGAGAIDRWTLFERCMFYNAVDSTSTTVSVVASLNAAAGGSLVMQGCTAAGATKWGDAGALANMYVDNAPPTAATSGLAVNPS